MSNGKETAGQKFKRENRAKKMAMDAQKEADRLQALAGDAMSIAPEDKYLTEDEQAAEAERQAAAQYDMDARIAKTLERGPVEGPTDLAALKPVDDGATGKQQPPPALGTGVVESPEKAEARVMAQALTGGQGMLARHRKAMLASEMAGKRGIAEELAGIEKQGFWEGMKNVAIATQTEKRALALEQERTQIVDAEKIRQDAKVKAEGNIAKAEEMVQNFEIDPRRIYKDSFTAFGSALAVALGSFGAALAGGPNTAFQIIDKAVSRDIAAQRTELSKLQYMVGQKQNFYSRMMSEHKDQRNVELLLRGQADKLFAVELDKIEARYGMMISTAKVEQLRGQLKVRDADRKQAYATNLFNADYKVYSTNMAYKASAAKLSATQAVNAAKGFGDADMRKAMRQAIAAKNSIKRGIDFIKKGEKGQGPEISGGAAGVFFGYQPFVWTNEDTFSANMDKLALSVIMSKSGASYTDESYNEVRRGLPKFRDMNDTKIEKLEEALNDLDDTLLGNYEIMNPMEKNYFTQVMGYRPTGVGKGSQQIKAIGK